MSNFSFHYYRSSGITYVKVHTDSGQHDCRTLKLSLDRIYSIQRIKALHGIRASVYVNA